MNTEQVAALVGASVLVFWMLGAYNRLVALRSAIGVAWTKVDQALRERAETVAPLVTALREPLAAEHGALDALLAAQQQSLQATAALAAGTVAVGTAADWVAAEGALTAAASRVFALLDQHAELRAQEPRLAFRRQSFNEAAFSYNAALQQFPTRLLVRLFGFARAGRI